VHSTQSEQAEDNACLCSIKTRRTHFRAGEGMKKNGNERTVLLNALNVVQCSKNGKNGDC
jgi:hypothetical protein